MVAFGPKDSNLASAPAFPVLAGNALAGSPVRLRPARGVRAGVVQRRRDGVTDPKGAAVPLTRLPGELMGVLRTPGFYAVEEGRSRSTFAVNVTDPAVSNLTRSSVAAKAGAAGGAGGPRPWWLYFAVAAFAAILLEWWTWLRRITV